MPIARVRALAGGVVALSLFGPNQPVSAQADSSPTCSSPQSAVPAALHVVIRSNHFLITTCRGGRTLSFILDTGAGASLFDLAVAESLGIRMGAAGRSGGAGPGQVTAAQLATDSVRLAGTNIVVRVGRAIDLRAVSDRAGLHVDGIL